MVKRRMSLFLAYQEGKEVHWLRVEGLSKVPDVPVEWILV